MKWITQIFDFYIQSSIHVALSCYALVRMTHHMFHIPNDEPMAYFVFFGTIVGYNFVKYEGLVRTKKKLINIEIKRIVFFSFFSFLAVGFYFFQLQRITQIISLAFLGITLLYTLPFFPNRKNARNWAGIKIYIVALCWAGITLILPLLNADITITSDFYLKCIQRFILIFVLILIFEILDLKYDDPHLKTVPQQIGVKRTKILGLLLLLPFYFMEFLKTNFDKNQLFVNLILVIVISLLLLFANEKRSKYYTSFWVESVPIVWWLMVFCYFEYSRNYLIC